MDKNLPTIHDVVNQFDSLFKIIDLLDSTYKMERGNFLMKYYQNRGITLRDIFIKDMLNWLCFLGWEDHHIHENEVKFINLLLNMNLTQLDVLEIVKGLNLRTLATLPLSFAIFIEYIELRGSSFDKGPQFIEALYNSFALAGTYFIICDGDIDENEIKGLEAYLKTLENNIRTFNLDSLHDYMLENI